MVGFRLTAAACILATFWTLHALKINQVRTFFSRIKQSAKKVDWLSLVKRLQHTADKLGRYRKTIKFDISAGYGSISSPELAPLDVLSEILEVEVVSRKSPVLWAHQVVKKTVKKAPDKALLGVLVLIASELLRRGVNSDKYVLPPLLREIANNTSIELDAKLEMLSSLDWKADPFLKGEYENLQSQPLEVLDKFIVTSILPSVDKDLAPFLLKSMVGDTAQVKIMVQSLKEVIKISMLVLEKTATGNIQTVAPLLTVAPSLLDQTTLTINRTTSTIISQVDFVGQGIEEGNTMILSARIFSHKLYVPSVETFEHNILNFVLFLSQLSTTGIETSCNFPNRLQSI